MNIPLLDETDMEILMHRNAHFGANFDIMIRYYEDDGVGVNEEFDLDRIKLLAQTQKSLGEDLAEKVLPSHCIEDLERARDTYIKLRDVYDLKDAPVIARLISDLILSEDEEPIAEIQALTAQKNVAIDALLKLIASIDFYDPLFPGYGRSPVLAVRTLEKIGDPKIIPHLFLALGQPSIDAEDALIHALHSFGKEGKSFLLKRVQEKPYASDNEQAASALASFLPDEEVETVALKLLNESDVLAKETFASYLTCLLAETTNPTSLSKIEQLSKKKDIPHSVQAECLNLLNSRKHI